VVESEGNMNTEHGTGDTVAIDVRDRNKNAVRAGLHLIPYIGQTLDRLIFGNLEELRWRRVEATLRELADTMKVRNIPAEAVATEHFVNLLEKIAPALGRATHEDKRQRFRDLLLNATQIHDSDWQWQEADLAARLLTVIEAPGLALIASIFPIAPEIEAHRRSPAWFYLDYEDDWRRAPTLVSLAPAIGFNETWDTPLPYPYVLLSEWVERLARRRVFETGENDGGTLKGFRLTDLGRSFAQWAIDAPGAQAPPPPKESDGGPA
jgi:hypothetical protein